MSDDTDDCSGLLLEISFFHGNNERKSLRTMLFGTDPIAHTSWKAKSTNFVYDGNMYNKTTRLIQLYLGVPYLQTDPIWWTAAVSLTETFVSRRPEFWSWNPRLVGNLLCRCQSLLVMNRWLNRLHLWAELNRTNSLYMPFDLLLVYMARITSSVVVTRTIVLSTVQRLGGK